MRRTGADVERDAGPGGLAGDREARPGREDRQVHPREPARRHGLLGQNGEYNIAQGY